MPEGRLVFPDFTVAETLRMGAYLPRARPGWRERAERCLRNCLCMFRPDGSATAAWMLPFSTVMLDDRGEPLFPRQLGEGPDPFVNDMDLALYIAMASGLFGDFGGEKADATFPRVR